MKKFTLPKELIVLISGVPGVGKTTISNGLLNAYKEFRLVEETDVIREILRGYNCTLTSDLEITINNIYPHNVFLDYNMAKEQCKVMKNSLLHIIKRQQRKKLPSIINGVHIIPEELYQELPKNNIIYINLYVDSEQILWNRLKDRNPEKYKIECIPLLFQTNIKLKKSIKKLQKELYSAYTINVSSLTVQETLNKIDLIFTNLFKD